MDQTASRDEYYVALEADRADRPLVLASSIPQRSDELCAAHVTELIEAQRQESSG